jgi:hypothetical protein
MASIRERPIEKAFTNDFGETFSSGFGLLLTMQMSRLPAQRVEE